MPNPGEPSVRIVKPNQPKTLKAETQRGSGANILTGRVRAWWIRIDLRSEDRIPNSGRSLVCFNDLKGSGANGEFSIRIQCYCGELGTGMSYGKGRKAMCGGRHFDRKVIMLCVRWYLRYKLSLRDLVEMMAERGLALAHTTITRWVQRYVRSSKRVGLAMHAKTSDKQYTAS